MTTYSKINWYDKGGDKAIEFLYEELGDNESHSFFKFLMENYPDLEIDWLEVFEDLKESLVKQEKIDDILFFVNWYIAKFPDTYYKRYEFIESDLCDYYIHKKDWSNVEQRIAVIRNNPAAGIDTLTTKLLFQLIYNGQKNLAVNYAQAVWQPINESEELIGFAAYPFINTIYVNELQDCYEAWRNNIPFDEAKLLQQTITLGFDGDEELFNTVLRCLKTDLDLVEVKRSIAKKEDAHMLILNIHFLKFMLTEYNLPFIFSEWIWNFIATTKIFGKQKGIENWFYLNTKILDKYIAEKFDSFLRSNELEVFGKVYALDYIFQFLNRQQLLSDVLYLQMLENTRYFKNQMIRISTDNLWQFTFVFDWPGISNYSADTEEKKLFEATYHAERNQVIENANRFLANYIIPERIKDELKLNNHSNKPVWEEHMPYIKTENKIGRNDPCSCGSGKKYKNCCLKESGLI